MIARFHAAAIKRIPGCELRAIYARRPEVANALASQFDCEAYSDFERFLAEADIDVVTIATPSGAHLEPALAVAAAGKHIICEKPLEVTLDRVDALITACRTAGVTLAGVFNRRFHPTVQLTKAAVECGRFGRLTVCGASVPWYRSQEYYDSGAWRGTWELDGGGALMNQGIHTVDQLLYVAGPVEWVQATAGCLAHDRIEVEDTVVATVGFAGGALGTIVASTACWSTNGNPAEVTVCGTEGTVILSDERFRRWEFRHADEQMDREAEGFIGDVVAGAGANDPGSIDVAGHVANFTDVVEAIRHGRQPLVDGSEARRSVAVVRAIYESAAAGGLRVPVK